MNELLAIFWVYWMVNDFKILTLYPFSDLYMILCKLEGYLRMPPLPHPLCVHTDRCISRITSQYFSQWKLREAQLVTLEKIPWCTTGLTFNTCKFFSQTHSFVSPETLRIPHTWLPQVSRMLKMQLFLRQTRLCSAKGLAFLAPEHPSLSHLAGIWITADWPSHLD